MARVAQLPRKRQRIRAMLEVRDDPPLPGYAFKLAYYSLFEIGVTMLCNVPLNNALAALQPATTEAGEL